MIPIRTVKTYGAAVAQSVREDILRDADWAHSGAQEVIVLEKMGVYGAVTATFGMFLGRKIITDEGSECDGTSFGADWSKVPLVNITLPPNTDLRLFMTDSAADPAGLTVAVKGYVLERGVDF